MSERDLSGIWFTGERERNISGALCFDRERLSRAHAHRAEYRAECHAAPLRSHALLQSHS